MKQPNKKLLSVTSPRHIVLTTQVKFSVRVIRKDINLMSLQKGKLGLSYCKVE